MLLALALPRRCTPGKSASAWWSSKEGRGAGQGKNSECDLYLSRGGVPRRPGGYRRGHPSARPHGGYYVVQTEPIISAELLEELRRYQAIAPAELEAHIARRGGLRVLPAGAGGLAEEL